MSSPNEMQVLRITQDAQKVNRFIISRRMEITTIYAHNLLATLAMKGYLQKAKQGKFGVYKLTPKGHQVLTKIRLLKWVGAREREVLKLISDLTRASTNVIGRQLIISNDYALLMCKSLGGLNLRAAYLKEIRPCVYGLTPLGEKLVGKKR